MKRCHSPQQADVSKIGGLFALDYVHIDVEVPWPTSLVISKKSLQIVSLNLTQVHFSDTSVSRCQAVFHSHSLRTHQAQVRGVDREGR